ncbi:hypothetical protein [Streptococcus vestibularis]|uniref:hypothetical protein n=1 Tax=Streptococcus vestibularis TaxID=1343 RepID=UPI001D0A1339|nr:hypothetical protein [Streptococcus vestibularis]MCB8556819.1 hypothetical protein [Streptococcus vestibularis]MCB8587609.1 hypothetical protein [Streptococcus vestibularis]MDU2328177.1 hypothetical protein [Streptococcus salivarius]DAS10139.1 MAG TPA: hypothetical protein [Caudoviricetes sp.]
MESFNEKIAQVRTTINDDDNTDFTEFYGVKNFPVNFDLNVSVMLLNIIPDKNYTIQIGITSDTTPLQVLQIDTQNFSIQKDNMILMHNGVGQAFIKTQFKFNVTHEGAYKIEFVLLDDKELSSFANYYYFGGA